MKICIVTPDLLGPVRNGGIGTACTNLARALAQAEHEISVLFTQLGTLAARRDAWIRQYAKEGIRVAIAQEWINARPARNFFPNHAPLIMSHYIYEWLKDKDFDLIIFMEWQGNGFYSLHAKRAGLSFQNTVLVVQIHSPSLWHDLYNASLPRHHEQVLSYFMERKCIELADLAVSPSRYMFNWLKQAGYALPRRSCVIPNLIDVSSAPQPAHAQSAKVQELVFFGRLEYRKGLVQFCDALDRLAGSRNLPIEVTFLGKFSYVGDTHSAVYISNRGRNWPIPIKILSQFDQAEALAYLKQPGKLAVIPSVMDNSPYTVYECLTHRIPFIARNAGGTSELIAAKDHAGCLFTDNPESLKSLMEHALGKPASVPRLAFPLDKPRKLWTRDFIAKCSSLRAKVAKPTASALPFISVCLTHYNRPKLLRQAIDSLRAQEYKRFEVILVDDGSNTKEAQDYLQSLAPEFDRKKWRLLRSRNGYLGRARNQAVKLARGDYLLFMDDDNVAMPDTLARFARAAAASKAEVVTSSFNVFTTMQPPSHKTGIAEIYLPAGDCVAYAAIANIMGDANSLIEAKAFRKLGGFTEDYGVGHEDFELFLKAALGQCRFSVIGSPSFWYRRSTTSMLASTSRQANLARSMRPFLTGEGSATQGEMALLAHIHAPALPTVPNSIQGDPEATEALLQACMAFHSNGMAYLADQVANTIESADFQEKYQQHQSLLELAGNTEFLARLPAEALQARIKKAGTEHQQLPELLKKSLEHLIEKRVRNDEHVEVIAQTLPHDAGLAFLAARYYQTTGRTQDSHRHLDRLIMLSDKEYLRNRKDVERAVQRGEFVDGLHHFIAHGARERTPWPYAPLIKSLMHELSPAWPSATRSPVQSSDKRRMLFEYIQAAP